MSESNQSKANRSAIGFTAKIEHYLASSLRQDLPWPIWKRWQLILFRFAFLFLLLFIIPIDWKFYKSIIAINWFDLHFYDLLSLARYQPAFIPLSSTDGVPILGIAAFANWLFVFLLAIIGTFIWSMLSSRRKEYIVWYHWLRVVVRYRMAIALLAYGTYKLFNLQLPYPSLSDLLTKYGDFYAWKIYFQTTAISPVYESFLGFVEILAALLLLNRRTVTLGAGLIIGFLSNVASANGFYDIGETSFSALMVVFAVFLFVNDTPKLYKLLLKEDLAIANRIIPDNTKRSFKTIKRITNAFVLVFVIAVSITAYKDGINGSYKLPKTPGLEDAFGLYDVKEFVLNHDTIPYSEADPRRWQDVVFEKWSTISINVNRPVTIDKTSGEEFHSKDIDRNYELAGQGGRHYFYYEIDHQHNRLLLQNKNRYHRNEKLSLNYSRPNTNTLILQGVNENQDSIRIVLEKSSRKHLMYDGRRHPIAL